MSADAVTRITRRHRFATARDLGFAFALTALLGLAAAQVLAPLAL